MPKCDVVMEFNEICGSVVERGQAGLCQKILQGVFGVQNQ